MANINRFIDHTNLKPNATTKDIEQLCAEAQSHGFAAVCVNGCHVERARALLENTKVKIATVIGFPLGAMSTVTKICEAKDAKAKGADEIDMVINIGWLKSGHNQKVQKEIQRIKAEIGTMPLKVILETCYLSDTEKQKACELAVAAGADYVKTSTGFGSGGATLEDIELMKEAVKGKLKIKASGGIRDKKTALAYIGMGVDRIGTSSGPIIIKS